MWRHKERELLAGWVHVLSTFQIAVESHIKEGWESEAKFDIGNVESQKWFLQKQITHENLKKTLDITWRMNDYNLYEATCIFWQFVLKYLVHIFVKILTNFVAFYVPEIGFFV